MMTDRLHNKSGGVIKKSFALFFLAFGLLFFILCAQLAIKSMTVRLWPTVDGKVISASVEARTKNIKGFLGRRMRNIYYAQIEYQYDVDGRGYKSNRLSLIESTSREKEDIVHIVNYYKKQGVVKVSYNPKNHREAVLDLAAGEGIIIFLVGSFLFVFAGLMLIARK